MFIDRVCLASHLALGTLFQLLRPEPWQAATAMPLCGFIEIRVPEVTLAWQMPSPLSHILSLDFSFLIHTDDYAFCGYCESHQHPYGED